MARIAKALKASCYPLLVLALYGATFIPHTAPWVYWKLSASSYLYALCIAAGCAALYALRPTRAVLSAIGHAVTRSNKIPSIVLLVLAAASFFCLSYYISGDLFGHVPTEMDSMAQYAGAKIFAHGHWVLPSHLLPRFFDTYWFINDGKFYTFYPPGHMFLLAVGHLLGNPAMINPMLGALSLVATYFLTKEIGGVKAARISLLLFLLSPFIVFLASEYDNRATALLCTTLFLLFFVKAIKSNRSAYGIISGVALGYCFITRPQTAVPVAFPFMVYGLWLLAHHWRAWWRIFAAITVAAMPFIGFFLFYNYQTTGDAFLTGYQKYFGEQVVPAHGFQSLSSWKNWPQEFARVVIYVQLLHEQFFGWPVSSLLLVAVLFLFKAQRPFCGLIVAAFFSVMLALTLTPYTFFVFGPRYLYEMSSIVIAFTAISLHRLPAIARAYGHIKIALPRWRGMFLAVLVLLVAIALNTTIATLYVSYGYNYRQGRLEFANKVNSIVEKPALVLIRNPSLYNSFAYRQPPDDNDDIIFARDLGEDNELLMQYYLERHVYIVRDGHEITRVR